MIFFLKQIWQIGILMWTDRTFKKQYPIYHLKTTSFSFKNYIKLKIRILEIVENWLIATHCFLICDASFERNVSQLIIFQLIQEL